MTKVGALAGLRYLMGCTAWAVVALVAATGSVRASTWQFEYVGAIVEWTAPATATYRVTATGAQGASGSLTLEGGRGAQIAGDFDLMAGAVFRIAVGGAGKSESFSAGGGGGTFFVTADDLPLLVAGGGGGTRGSGTRQKGTDASITTFAYTASGSASTYIPALKTIGEGQGGVASSPSWGSAGAGFFSDGQDDQAQQGSVIYGRGGKSWFNGLAGGGPNRCCVTITITGGFGGGGAGEGGAGGGGGGGYSGGDGGRVAGGGGSFNAGANPLALAGVGLGNGSLRIEWLNAPVIPVPAALPLLLSALALLGLAKAQRRVVGG